MFYSTRMKDFDIVSKEKSWTAYRLSENTNDKRFHVAINFA